VNADTAIVGSGAFFHYCHKIKGLMALRIHHSNCPLCLQKNPDYISKFCNTFKKIVFKNNHKLPKEKIELLIESPEKNDQSSKIIDEILEKSKEQSMEIIEQNLIQNTQLYTEFVKEFSKENHNQNQDIKKQLSLQFTKHVSELKEELLQEINNLYETNTKKMEEQILKNRNQSRQENFDNTVQIKQQNLQYITQNRQKISEVVNKITKEYKAEIKGFIEQILKINSQTKKVYNDLILQNKKQISETCLVNCNDSCFFISWF